MWSRGSPDRSDDPAGFDHPDGGLFDPPLGEAVADAAAEGVDEVLVRVLRVLGLVEPVAAAGPLAAVVLERRLQLGAPRMDQEQPLVEQDLELIEAVGDAVPGPVGEVPGAEDALELAVGGRSDAGAGVGRGVQPDRVEPPLAGQGLAV